ncbi:hypothetical protein F4604DRAFT_1684357 [Suillus subluteus]|nr:hypothetical protein F4604DRAFT_1684357 [Suillus subluteus]
MPTIIRINTIFDSGEIQVVMVGNTKSNGIGYKISVSILDVWGIFRTSAAAVRDSGCLSTLMSKPTLHIMVQVKYARGRSTTEQSIVCMWHIDVLAFFPLLHWVSVFMVATCTATIVGNVEHGDSDMDSEDVSNNAFDSDLNECVILTGSLNLVSLQLEEVSLQQHFIATSKLPAVLHRLFCDA